MDRIWILSLGLLLVLSFGCTTEQQTTKYVCPDELKTVVNDPSECPSEDSQDLWNERPLLDTMDLQAMKELGLSIHCSIEYELSNGETIYLEAYIMGDDTRVDTSSSDPVVSDVSIISQGGWTYISTWEGGGADEQCDWVGMEFARVKECYPEFEPSSLESVPDEAKTDCRYEHFTDEKFEPTGRVCDGTDELCEAYAGHQ